MRRWTVKDDKGAYWLDTYSASTRRNLERDLVPEYVGTEETWNHGYAQSFADDLADTLERCKWQIVCVEVDVKEIEQT